MSDDAPPDPSSRLPGFNAYADDRPRAGAQPAPLAADDPDEAWSDGEAAAPPEFAPVDSARPNWRKPALLAATAVAVVGLGAVLAAQSFGSRPNAGPPDTAADPSLRVELAQPSPPSAPQASADRLEVLIPSPTGARFAPQPQQARGRDDVAPGASPKPTPRSATVEASPAAAFARDAVGAASVSPSPLDACRDAGSWAAALVCSDRELAVLDRRMKRAYASARDAGVPAGALRDDQRDWLDIREEAARHSRNAVEDIYRQRIDELQEAVRADF